MEFECGGCGRELPEGGSSLDFCDAGCQALYWNRVNPTSKPWKPKGRDL